MEKFFFTLRSSDTWYNVLSINLLSQFRILAYKINTISCHANRTLTEKKYIWTIIVKVNFFFSYFYSWRTTITLKGNKIRSKQAHISRTNLLLFEIYLTRFMSDSSHNISVYMILRAVPLILSNPWFYFYFAVYEE